MLLPHQVAILTIDEANKLIEYIEKTTATKRNPQNYEKMRSVGILDTYNSLRSFVDEGFQQNRLRNLDVDEVAFKSDIEPRFRS